MERGCYVYGILRDETRLDLGDLKGVGGAPLSIVRAPPLSAVITDISRDELGTDDPRWFEEAVRGHELVLQRCLAAGGPVLPMRFASTFRSSNHVRDLLIEREVEFEGMLDRLSGTNEWGVKAVVESEALAVHIRDARPSLAQEERDIARRPPGTAYLTRKRLEQALEREGEQILADLALVAHNRLAAVSLEARLTPGAMPHHDGHRTYANGAYLVARDDEQRFQAALGDLRNDHAGLGLRYELTGPWPPYTFVSDEEISR